MWKEIKINLKFHCAIYSLSTFVEGTIVSLLMKFSTNQPPQPHPEKGLLNINNILNEDVEQKLYMIWLYLSNTLQKQNGLSFFSLISYMHGLWVLNRWHYPLIIKERGAAFEHEFIGQNRQNRNGKEQMEWFHFT